MSVGEGARKRPSLVRKSSEKLGNARMVAVQQNECENSSAKFGKAWENR